MGIKTTTFFDSKAAVRRRIIYALCALVVAGCGVAFFLLSREKKEEAGSAEPERARAPEEPAGEHVPPDDDPPPPLPEVAPPPDLPEGPGGGRLRQAHALFDEAQGYMKTATADLSSPEGRKALRSALELLLEAQAVYESYLEEHPEEERRLTRRMADLQRELYWCRKSMPASEFPGSDGPPTPPLPEPARPPVRRTPPPAEPPPPAPTEIRPGVAARRFANAARRALREGRPDQIVEAGAPLLEDPRMADHLGNIPDVVRTARTLMAFLDAAREAIAGSVGEEVRLRLRNGEVTGTLLSAEDDLVLKTEKGERSVSTSDLAAVELLARTEEAKALDHPKKRLAAGAYLLLRGDEEVGAREILTARAGGADVSGVERELTRVVTRSPELLAFAHWLTLRPHLEDLTPELPAKVEEFKAKHRATGCFEQHREELFEASARVVRANPVKIGDIYGGESKISGKRAIRLQYAFDRPEELEDFGADGTWKIEDGKLIGGRGSLWLERFMTENVDLRFTLDGSATATVGIWGKDKRGSGGVNLTVQPTGTGLTLVLKHRDREIGKEVVRDPGDELEFVLSKRDRKYQVRLNRKVVLKGNDLSNRPTDHLNRIGILSRGDRVALLDLELKTDLDLDWAKAGGGRFTNFIRDWYLAGPFSIDPRDVEGSLGREEWPQTRAFAPGDASWRFHRSTHDWLTLSGLMKPNKHTAAYAAIRVWSPARRSGLLEIEAQYDARAWLNGELALKRAPTGSAHRGSVKLVPGENLLLVKVVEATGNWWWLKARFLTKSGEAMRDLQYW